MKMKLKRLLMGVMGVMVCGIGYGVGGESKEEQLREREGTVVLVKYGIQHEVERQSEKRYGTVIDDRGLIVVVDLMNGEVPVERLRDLKVYLAGEEQEGYEGEYIGSDEIRHLSFIRLGEVGRKRVKGASGYGIGKVERGGRIWGMGGMGIDGDRFKVGYVGGELYGEERMPWKVGISFSGIGSVGSSVWDEEGRWLGVVMGSIGKGYELVDERAPERGGMKVLLYGSKVGELYLSSEELMKYVGRDMEGEFKRKRSWCGFVGIEGMDYEVLKLMGERGGALFSVSEVIEGGPGWKAGIRGRDIIRKVDGEQVGRYSEKGYGERALALKLREKGVGEKVKLEVMRDGGVKEVEVVLEEGPKLVRECRHEYYERLGLTVREGTLEDNVANREYTQDYRGVVCSFVRKSGPGDDALMKEGDRILGINNEPIESMGKAFEELKKIDGDGKVKSVLFLVEREGESKVFRLKLD